MWRTGALPPGSHGAGVIGLTGSTLMKLSSFAGELVGARRGLDSLAVYTCAQEDRLYDPSFDAACPLVARYARWLWDGNLDFPYYVEDGLEHDPG
eukprot:988074-Pyramimonas_sp.AAC.1